VISGSGRIDERPGPEEQAAAGQRARLVNAALDRLNLGRRCILILHDVLDVGIAEIARELGINRNTAQNRLRMARADFGAAVRRMGEEKRRALELDERSPPPGARGSSEASPRGAPGGGPAGRAPRTKRRPRPRP
jgi:RNA polymerase sigma-70 factor (ECF subfamily)